SGTRADRKRLGTLPDSGGQPLSPDNRDARHEARNMMSSSTATISGQPGPQTEFLRSPADICIYGGAAGGGKTVGLILEPLRHVGRIANFTAVFFRRTTPQITIPGGLWAAHHNIYPQQCG